MQKEKSSKLITPEQRSEIERLHRECEKAHRQTKRSTYDKLKKLFVEEWAFGKPVIPSPSAGEQWKYTYLLALLRASDTDTKLYVLANWLKHENVCRPRELLPQQVFARVTAEQSKRVERFGWNDFYYGRVIQAWLPYCESLLSDMRAAAQGGWDQAVHLRELGYDPDLVALALSRRMGGRPRRSATELACEWVAQQNWVEVAKKRQDPDLAKTLRNAYSRVRKSFQCAFCERLIIGEFRGPGQAFAGHCQEHAAERLPGSSHSGWTDRYGRLWWQSGGEVRCSKVLPTQK